MLALGQFADRRIIRILLKTLAVALLVFAAVAIGGWYAIDWALARAGLSDSLFAGSEELRGLASLLFALLGLWIAWRIVALAVVQFYADEVVQAVEASSYPEIAGQARDLPVREQLSTSIRAALRALAANLIALPFALVLLVTGVGAALLLWLVNAILVGRELQDMVWLRHRRDAADPPPVSAGERFVLGGLIAALLALPVINLAAPILGAAAATHLIHRNHRHLDAKRRQGRS